MFCVCWMRSGVVVSALASITEVKPRGAWLVLRWATVSGFNSQCRRLISICNWPATHACWAFHPSGVGKWVPASAGKAKAGMVHSVSGCTRGVQVKLRDPLRTRAIPERLRGVFTTRRYTDPRLSLPYLILFTVLFPLFEQLKLNLKLFIVRSIWHTWIQASVLVWMKTAFTASALVISCLAKVSF